MKIIKLTAKEQLESLKKGDRLIVQWKYLPGSGHKFNEITMTRIWGLNHNHEVIVRKSDNLYFNIDTFLNGESCAKEVYLIDESEDK